MTIGGEPKNTQIPETQEEKDSRLITHICQNPVKMEMGIL